MVSVVDGFLSTIQIIVGVGGGIYAVIGLAMLITALRSTSGGDTEKPVTMMIQGVAIAAAVIAIEALVRVALGTVS